MLIFLDTATDVLITLSSTYFLATARKNALSQTRKMISGLIKVCCQTALPATTACVAFLFSILLFANEDSSTLLELICSRLGSGAKKFKPQATNAIILVLLDIVPIIYACVSDVSFLSL
jgi:hypothetical protein